MQQEKANRNVFKAKAYQKVLGQIQDLSDDVAIRTMEDLDQAHIQGIGSSIRAKLEEILATGTTQAIDADRVRAIESIEALSSIMSIGPVKAKDLYEKHGIDSIETLIERVQQTPDLLNDKQKMGLHYHAEFTLRIPREEMIKHEAYIRKAIEDSAVLRKVIPLDALAIAGSYRRGLTSSGDIDVLMTGTENHLHELVEMLKTKKYIVDVFALGEKKLMAVCKLPRHKHYRRIDIMHTAPEQFPFALLYFTGSQKFNILMRQQALNLGYSMNEYGLTPTRSGSGSGSDSDSDSGSATENAAAPPVLRSEHEVFAFLNLMYVPPTEREAVGSSGVLAVL
jgi:DNA polymerase/3'-5' exonuclease PolX